MQATHSGQRPNFTAAASNAEGLKWEGHMADDVAATYGPEPLALLIATKDRLYLSSSRGNYGFPRDAVTKLGRGKFYPWCFAAIQIQHQIPGFPKTLQFKPLNVRIPDLLQQLHQMGYPKA